MVFVLVPSPAQELNRAAASGLAGVQVIDRVIQVDRPVTLNERGEVEFVPHGPAWPHALAQLTEQVDTGKVYGRGPASRQPWAGPLRPEPPRRLAPQHPFVSHLRSGPVSTTAGGDAIGGMPQQTCTEPWVSQRLPGSRSLITVPTSAGELAVCVAFNAAKSVRCPVCHWVFCSGDRGSPPMIALPLTCHRSR